MSTPRGGIAVIAMAALAFGAFGCGGDSDESADSSAGADTAAAEKSVAEAQKEVTEFDPPGPAFDASKTSGKTIWFEQYDASSPTTAIWRQNLDEAVAPYGVEVENFDGQGQVSVQAQGVQQAISQGAGVIILSGVDPASISSQIKAADKAGIPVIIGSNGVVGIPDQPGVTAAVTINHQRVGELLADWAVAQNGADANLYGITHSAILGASVITDSLGSHLKELCPDCEYEVNDLPFSKINTLPNVAQTAITSNPDLTQITPVYDFETLSIVPGIKQAGAAGENVTTASFNALGDVIKAMQDGDPISADVGAPNPYVGYAYADQAMRLLAGEEPVADENVPLRLFTQENVQGLDPEGDVQDLYGPIDWEAGYAKLWGKPGQ